MEYTKRRNLNRGCMKLEAWQRGIDLFRLACELSENIGDYKLKSQFRDAAQSVSANIAEGYGRRSLPEYIQFLYVAKGSLGEALTRGIGFQTVGLINGRQFEEFDALHYEVENKLLRLIQSLENKRDHHDWCDVLPSSHPADRDPSVPIHQSNNPPIHQSTNPSIPLHP